MMFGTSLWFWHPSLIASAGCLLFFSQRQFTQRWSFLHLIVFGMVSACFWQASWVVSLFFGIGSLMVSFPFHWIRKENLKKGLVFLRELLWFCFALSCIVFVFPEYVAGAEFWILMGGVFILKKIKIARNIS